MLEGDRETRLTGMPISGGVALEEACLFRERQVLPGNPVGVLEVMANINLAGEVADAVAVKAESAGLCGREFKFVAADRMLTEDEQIERCASVVRHLTGLAQS